MATALAPFNAPRVSRKETPKIEHKLWSSETAIKGINEKDRTVEAVISAFAVDRDGEVLVPRGCQYQEYMRNPVIFLNHDSRSLPIAQCVDISVSDGEVVALARFAGLAQLHEKAETCFRLIRDKFMRATSVGFQPIKETREKLLPAQVGRGILTWSLVEWSFVGIPALPSALVRMAKSFDLPDGASESDLAQALGVTPLAKYWSIAEQILPATEPIPGEPMLTPGLGLSRYLSMRSDLPDSEPVVGETDPLRWNAAHSKLFDVAAERAEPARLELAWASKYLGVDVKDIYRTETFVPSIRMGAFLLAEETHYADWSVDGVRNLLTNLQDDGKEIPPAYETIALNSKRSRDFLVQGLRFLRRVEGEKTIRAVVKHTPEWAGMSAVLYMTDEHRAEAAHTFGKIHQAGRDLKLLKGEAFSLSGEFIARGDETWGDLFLPETNFAPVKRSVEVLETQGADAASKGLILCGPPGCGKTLAMRIAMNAAPGTTFVWVSARDFHRMGAFGGFSYAFDVADENRGAVVFFEDADTWFSESTIDLLKTELDGFKRKRGVLTVIATNFPERLPEALIDRPGRFHDVLKFGLPDTDVRVAMLAKWCPDLSDEERASLAEATDGMSGAHVRYLAEFADTLRHEDVSLTAADAAGRALEKVKAQRDLIDSVQRSSYRPRAPVVEAVKVATEIVRDTKTADAAVEAIKRVVAIQIREIEDEADQKIGRLFRGDRKSFAGFEEYGYTAPAAGATSPTHVHDYELEGEAGAFESGWAHEVADHSHRITAASLSRGETEASDGHAHSLMTASDVMAALAQAPVFTLGMSDFAIKDGRVLAATNYAKLKTAHAMVAEVIAAHDASRPAPEDKPEPPAKFDAAALTKEIASRLHATEPADAEIWFDADTLARDLRARLAVHPSHGAAGR